MKQLIVLTIVIPFVFSKPLIINNEYYYQKHFHLEFFVKSMLPSRIWLAVALASPLASARPSGCDASEIDSIDACMKPQLMSRGLREWVGCRNPFTGTLYEEQSDKSRINPLNWFGGCPESKQGKQGQPAQQAQRITGSSGSAHSKGSGEAVDDPSSASNPNANQVNAPAIEVVDRIPSLTESMDGVGLDHSGSARGTFPNQPQSTGINNARSGLQSAPSSREGKKTVLYYGNYVCSFFLSDGASDRSLLWQRPSMIANITQQTFRLKKSLI